MAETVDALTLPDYSARRINQPWKHVVTPNAVVSGAPADAKE
jgi:hypothetical protein